MSTRKPPKNDSVVAAFLGKMADESGKTRRQIARACGFTECMVTQLTNGTRKVPLTQVLPLATAIGADAAELMLMCLAEYHPEVLQVLGINVTG